MISNAGAPSKMERMPTKSSIAAGAGLRPERVLGLATTSSNSEQHGKRKDNPTQLQDVKWESEANTDARTDNAPPIPHRVVQ